MCHSVRLSLCFSLYLWLTPCLTLLALGCSEGIAYPPSTDTGTGAGAGTPGSEYSFRFVDRKERDKVARYLSLRRLVVAEAGEGSRGPLKKAVEQYDLETGATMMVRKCVCVVPCCVSVHVITLRQ